MEALVTLALVCVTATLALMLARAGVRASSAEAAIETERRLREQDAANADEKLELVRSERDALETNLKAIAADVLSGTTDQLVKIAGEQRSADKDAAVSELERRTSEVKSAVGPVAEHLKKLEAQVEALQRERKGTEASVRALFARTTDELGKLRTETGALVDALKRPQVRGSWGEIQLRNVVRIAGMTDRVDFHEQTTVDSADGDGTRVRPDMTVHLPTGRDIVVDSKVPLDAYLAAIEARTDDERAIELDRHARQLRTHLDRLAGKAYHATLERSAEFVVCFIPNEGCYAAALDRDPSLLEYGAGKGVLLATPTTLLALLHATHYGWRQAAIEESAQAIADAAKELHQRVGIFTDHYAKVGRQLNAATESFNRSVGSFEGRVLPQLRRFEEAGAASAKEIGAPAQIDAVARELAAGERGLAEVAG